MQLLYEAGHKAKIILHVVFGTYYLKLVYHNFNLMVQGDNLLPPILAFGLEGLKVAIYCYEFAGFVTLHLSKELPAICHCLHC